MIESTVMECVCLEKNKIEKWIRRWGCAVSEALLDTECEIFQIPEIEGFIGYKKVCDCFVVYGTPVCAPENMPALAIAFQKFCEEKKTDFIFIIVPQPFTKWAIENICHVLIEIGEELTFDPRNDPLAGHKGHRLRNKIQHANHENMKVHENLGQNPELDKSINEAGATWLKGRKGPQIYLGKLNFNCNQEDRRCFYIEKNGKIFGAALLCKIEARRGWLLKYLIAIPKAPRGTTELLMLSILETLKNEGCNYLTYGMVPAANLGEVKGLGKLTTTMARLTFKVAKWIFRLNQRKTYWVQYLPKIEPNYLLFSKPNISLREIYAVLKAMNIRF